MRKSLSTTAASQEASAASSASFSFWSTPQSSNNNKTNDDNKSSNATLQRQYQRQTTNPRFAALNNNRSSSLWSSLPLQNSIPRYDHHRRTQLQQQSNSFWKASSSSVISPHHYYNNTAHKNNTTCSSLAAARNIKNGTILRKVRCPSVRFMTWMVTAVLFWILIVVERRTFVFYSAKTATTTTTASKSSLHPHHQQGSLKNADNVSPSVVATASSTSSVLSAAAAAPVARTNTSSSLEESSSSFQARNRSPEQLLVLPNRFTSPTTTTTTTSTIPPQASRLPSIGGMQQQQQILPGWLASYLKFQEQHVVTTSSYYASLSASSRRRTSRRRSPRVFQLKQQSSISNKTTTTTDAKAVYTLTYRCNGVTCGGLGDRLQGMVQAWYMALCTGRLFAIDWKKQQQSFSSRRRRRARHPGDHSRDRSAATTDEDEISSSWDRVGGSSSTLLDYLQPHQIQWDLDSDGDLPDLEVQAMDRHDNGFLMEPDSLPVETNVILSTNLWMENDFVQSQCWKNYRKRVGLDDGGAEEESSALALYQIAFRALFQWSPNVVAQAVMIRERATLSDAPYVAMHVRTGSLLDTDHSVKNNNGAARHGDPTDWHQFLQCAYKVRDTLRARWCRDSDTTSTGSSDVNLARNIELYLAADHVSVKTALLKEDPTIKTVLNLVIHHLDSKNNLDQGRNSQSDDNGSMMAFGELHVLHEAACLVKSQSKYSDVAAAVSPFQCAVYFDQCSEDAVLAAVAMMPYNSNITCE